MADAAVFEFVARELERVAGLGRSAARAAVRSVLAKALYAPDSVSVDQMQRVIERLLPPEIRASGVADAERVCQQIRSRLAAQTLLADGPESPDEIFSRMIRR
jgi:hypothetical protein